MLLLGAIADDFTGATDLASMLASEGMRVVQIIGVPDLTEDIAPIDADAVVIALKTRTAPAKIAVEQALMALKWLQANQVRQVIFKYCSTFDSTAEGNIGPVANALADALKMDLTIVCPAFPANGRTVFQGHLFVGDKLLEHSSMRHHPLTPMRDSALVPLMSSQSQRSVGLLPHQMVEAGPKTIQVTLDQMRKDGVRYAVADAINNRDLRNLGKALAQYSLITGGSGIAMGLPENFREQGLLNSNTPPHHIKVQGRRAVLAGSCSTATRAQIKDVAQTWPSRKLDAEALAQGGPVVADLLSWAMRQPADTPVVIYASADPDDVANLQTQYSAARIGALIEEAFGEIAVGLRSGGFASFVVAGGETSGAVVTALGSKRLRIGQTITTGVPWTESLDTTAVALALKSGNFGGPSFFSQAMDMLDE